MCSCLSFLTLSPPTFDINQVGLEIMLVNGYSRLKIEKVLDRWGNQCSINIPTDLFGLVFEFCKKLKFCANDSCVTEDVVFWSKTVRGKSTTVVNENLVQFDLPHGYLHTVATGGFVITQWPPKRDGVPIHESEGGQERLERCDIQVLENCSSFSFDMGNTGLNSFKLKHGIKEYDTFQFLGLLDFIEANKNKHICAMACIVLSKVYFDKKKHNDGVHLFHNVNTYCGKIFTNVPDKFVPVVCTRASNQCLVEYFNSDELTFFWLTLVSKKIISPVINRCAKVLCVFMKTKIKVCDSSQQIITTTKKRD
ncbi:hypothetical protein RFI_17765 [Reticulomyxa filosa]|uniref:Uncharacterized protein n=1 Tax=Reticulomyxa filosa TaxID=46433 RepID=X6N2D1_RETFI|nr:hypothetical protein RFI_17765 [Reticulomyxa filosa]|eukprot:ETO19467.1 hypothetical protein RFI_17765 [Reticulomyxa filosa]